MIVSWWSADPTTIEVDDVGEVEDNNDIDEWRWWLWLL
jgi:hypothetical protein